jgi:hypothetical protein
VTRPLPRPSIHRRPVLSRREAISLGVGAASAVALAACGGDDAASTTTEPIPVGKYAIAKRWPNTSLTPGNVRLAFSLVDPTTASVLPEGPDTISGTLLDDIGQEVQRFTSPRRGLGQGVPYWTVEAQLDVAGFYSLMLDDAPLQPAAFELFDPAQVAMPVPGRALPSFDTPTVDDARGVDPICTRLDGACPFHDLTVAEVLTSGKPAVVLVGTPAHCATGSCAPGLDFLIEVAPSYPDVQFVHAEVFADPEGTVIAPVIEAFELDYEPIVFVTDADGIVTERIDIVWDLADLRALLDRVLG